jgi:tight adherence protein B
MSRAALLAFAAGTAGVLGAWEALAAVERSRVAAALSRAVEPLVRAGREGRAATAPERRRLALLATAVLAAAGWLLGGVALASVAAIAGPALVVTALTARRRRYATGLRRGAAGAARALADAVGAGHSIRGAIAAAAAGGVGGPAGHELRAAAQALALGDPTAEVLERLRRRAGDPAWDAIVAGILLQRDAGGDLAGLLRDQATALEAADRIEREARTATAQARFTARLVLLLPIGAAALAELASPGLIAGLLMHPVSVWLVTLAAILQLTAILAVARLARAR